MHLLNFLNVVMVQLNWNFNNKSTDQCGKFWNSLY